MSSEFNKQLKEAIRMSKDIRTGMAKPESGKKTTKKVTKKKTTKKSTAKSETKGRKTERTQQEIEDIEDHLTGVAQEYFNEFIEDIADERNMELKTLKAKRGWAPMFKKDFEKQFKERIKEEYNNGSESEDKLKNFEIVISPGGFVEIRDPIFNSTKKEDDDEPEENSKQNKELEITEEELKDMIKDIFTRYSETAADDYRLDPEEVKSNANLIYLIKDNFIKDYKNKIIKSYNMMNPDKVVQLDFDIRPDGDVYISKLKFQSEIPKKQLRQQKLGEKFYDVILAETFLDKLPEDPAKTKEQELKEFRKHAKSGKQFDLSNADKRNRYFNLSPKKQLEMLALYEGWDVPDKKAFSGAKKYSNKIQAIDLPIPFNLTKKQQAKLLYNIRRKNMK